MKQKTNLNNTLRTIRIIGLILISPIVISALTCSLPVQDQSLKETSIAQYIQATLNAEKVMTLEAQHTQSSISNPTSTQSIGTSIDSTIRAQEATLNAHNTALAHSQTPGSEGQVTSTTQTPYSSTVTPDSIKITEWKMQSWVPLSSGCRLTDEPCWKSVPVADLDEILTSKNSVYIDPNWQNPCLSFWHQSVKRGSDNKFVAEILAGLNGKYVIIKNLDTFVESWKRDYADLEMFDGKDITFHFVRYPGTTSWYVQEVEVLANCPIP